MSTPLQAPSKGATYTRATPCRRCGGKEFYLSANKCQACAIAKTKRYYLKNREKCLTQRAEWERKNSKYRALYHKARRERIAEQKAGEA